MTLNWGVYDGLEFDSRHLHWDIGLAVMTLPCHGRDRGFKSRISRFGGALVFDGVGELRITLNNIVRFERAAVAA